MSTSFAGTVTKIFADPFVSKKTGKPGTAFKLAIADSSGQRLPLVGGFFEPPACQEGDDIIVTAVERNGYFNVVKGSLQVNKRQVATPAAPRQQEAPKPNGATPPAPTPAKPLERQGYRTNPEDAKRITYQASVSRAIEIVAVMLQHKALPISSATSKSAEADRNETVMAAIDKLTVKLFNDAMTLRLLDTVADTAPATKSEPLPEDTSSEDDDD